MDLGGSSMLWGLMFGAVGSGYFMYGRKLQKPVPLGCGLALIVLPYFISGTLPLVIVGAVFCLAPFLPPFAG